MVTWGGYSVKVGGIKVLIRKRKGWELPEREVTPEKVYCDRRRFLGSALGVAGLGATLGSPYLTGTKGVDTISNLSKLNSLRNSKYQPGRPVTKYEVATSYNNFYEFSLDKQAVKHVAKDFKFRPWRVEVGGMVERPLSFDVDDLIQKMTLEERIYRFRCVEAWSMVIPWVGFPMRKFIDWAKPTSRARFVRMITFDRPDEAPGQRSQPHYPWPYFEGLTMEEAMNELTMLVVGMYGRFLPNQNGAPIRLIVPWKYGFKSIKSIVRFEFVGKRPPTFWNQAVPNEYGFVANVNPKVPHPRWSQASERVVETGERIPTLPFNGYQDYVASLYR